MLKKHLLAAVCAVGFAGAMLSAPVFAAEGDQATAPIVDDQAEIDLLQVQIEQLIVDNAGDPDALNAAIAAFVTGSGNPELAAKAVIGALTAPKTAAAQLALANNPALKTAAAKGLGTAIAIIALTNPDAAAAMQASVEASGDDTIVTASNEGNSDQTASTQEQSQAQNEQQAQDSTPENPSSPN
jgi:hypothetical protein